MKKLIVLATVMFLIFAFTSTSWAQESKFQDPAKWLIGSWIGILDWGKETRTLEINEIGESVISDNRTMFNLIGNYGISGKKLDPIPITFVLFHDANANLFFTTPANTDVGVSRMSDRRMDGSFRPLKSKPQGIRFWKTGMQITDQKNKAFLGTWRGAWANFLEARAIVEHVDSSAASLRYEWGNLSNERETIREGWAWQNARITPKGTLEFITPNDGRTFTFSLSSNQKYLNGELFWPGPQSVNSIRMKKQE